MPDGTCREVQLSVRPNKMRANIDPQSARHFFLAHGPFVLNKRHRLTKALGRQNFIATKSDDTEALESLTLDALTEAPRKLLHIAIDGDQYGVIRQSRRANDRVRFPLG
jgi:hypothetical protein